MSSTAITWIIIGLIVLFVLWIIMIYNGLVALRQRVNQAFSDIDVQTKLRHDLIPNLVETVKGFAAQELSVFQAVADARAKMAGAQTPSDKIAAANAESSALSRLLVVVENYPQLKSDAQFMNLQDQLEGTENRIAFERKKYNDTARAYNTKRDTIPTVGVAGIFGSKFNEKPYYQAQAGAEKAPTVDFSP